MSDYNAFLEFAVWLARAAGRVVRQGAQRPIQVRSKGLRDLLTDVDLAAERTIVEAIHSRYPGHDILTEETPPGARTSRYCWIVDPLDGTGNFSRRYPCFSTSIALAEDDEPVAGVVYDPMRDHLFSAALGGGAALNGERLSVSRVDAMLDALIGMDWTRDAQTRAQNVQVIARLVPHCGTLRICGSAALGICYVGAGWWDAYWHLSLQPWDAAASALIVREAGGQVTGTAGERWTPGTHPCLASNGRLHRPFCEFVSCVVR